MIVEVCKNCGTDTHVSQNCFICRKCPKCCTCDNEPNWVARYHRDHVNYEIQDIMRCINFLFLKLGNETKEGSNLYQLHKILMVLKRDYYKLADESDEG